MDQGQAILIASAVAAGASLLNLILAFLSGRKKELRELHRKALEPHIQDISKALHEIAATSSILTKNRSTESIENWRKKAEWPKHRLRQIYVELRYPLWPIREAIRTISRLPDWIEHARGFDKHERVLLSYGSYLAYGLDWAIMRSYNKGRVPLFSDYLWVSFVRWRLLINYKKMQKDKKLQLLLDNGADAQCVRAYRPLEIKCVFSTIKM